MSTELGFRLLRALAGVALAATFFMPAAVLHRWYGAEVVVAPRGPLHRLRADGDAKPLAKDGRLMGWDVEDIPSGIALLGIAAPHLFGVIVAMTALAPSLSSTRTYSGVLMFNGFLLAAGTFMLWPVFYHPVGLVVGAAAAFCGALFPLAAIIFSRPTSIFRFNALTEGIVALAVLLFIVASYFLKGGERFAGPYLAAGACIAIAALSVRRLRVTSR